MRSTSRLAANFRSARSTAACDADGSSVSAACSAASLSAKRACSARYMPIAPSTWALPGAATSTASMVASAAAASLHCHCAWLSCQAISASAGWRVSTSRQTRSTVGQSRISRKASTSCNGNAGWIAGSSTWARNSAARRSARALASGDVAAQSPTTRGRGHPVVRVARTRATCVPPPNARHSDRSTRRSIRASLPTAGRLPPTRCCAARRQRGRVRRRTALAGRNARRSLPTASALAMHCGTPLQNAPRPRTGPRAIAARHPLQ